jgi:nickel-type superoxide dismutase maturation protease
VARARGAHRAWLPWGFAVVTGGSMLPNLRDGDRVVIRYRAAVRPGDVVLVRRPDRPEVTMVKRVGERRPDGWWVLGDNPYRSTDSREFGPVPAELVLGRVLRVRRTGGKWERVGAENPFE